MVQTLPVFDGVLPAQYALLATRVIYFLVTLVVVVLVGRVILQPVVRRLMDRAALDEHGRRPIRRAVHGLVYFVAVMAAFGAAGYGTVLQSLATIAAAATLAIGFALQDVIKNFVAGVFIYTDRPFKIGDWIEWGDHAGVVEDIKLRVTRVRTFDNELLTVPNSVLTSGVLKNPVDADRLRLKVLFGIGYDDDVEAATEIIVEEAERHDEILAEPGPSVRLTEMADSWVGLQSRIWIPDPARSDVVRIRSEYVQAVKRRFDEEGIDIPYPQRVLHGNLTVAETLTEE
ncbi:MAG: mechanosensitive ion channel family protein [Halobacteriales archaeon]